MIKYFDLIDEFIKVRCCSEELLQELHQAPITYVSWDPYYGQDGNYRIVSCSEDATIRTWSWVGTEAGNFLWNRSTSKSSCRT